MSGVGPPCLVEHTLRRSKAKDMVDDVNKNSCTGMGKTVSIVHIGRGIGLITKWITSLKLTPLCSRGQA